MDIDNTEDLKLFYPSVSVKKCTLSVHVASAKIKRFITWDSADPSSDVFIEFLVLSKCTAAATSVMRLGVGDDWLMSFYEIFESYKNV